MMKKMLDYNNYRIINDRKNKKEKEKMNKKQIKRFASFLVKKTKGLFHYEEDTWEQFFSKRQVVKHNKKLSICMKNKNYQFFCDCLFNAFDNLYKKEKV
tara:strand:- start:775 stop:1071 length:297 start_codon:yes stop_codon:yes gene_type:complete